MASVKRMLGFGPRSAPNHERLRHDELTGTSLTRVGLLAVILMIIAIFFAFSRQLPWQSGFKLNAVFANAIEIKPGAPVRIAGIDVGKVKGTSRYRGSKYVQVEMELDEKGLPVNRDATAKIATRIFLEGNYAVNLSPGSPSAPDLPPGSTIPVTQTASSVQFDEILTSLQSESRQDIKDVLKELAQGLSDASDSGPTGAQALNESFKYGGPALRDTALVSKAALGTGPRDLAKLIKGFQRTVTALDASESELQELIVNFNTTTAALASQSGALSRSISLLPSTLKTARSALAHTDSSLPSLNAFAREILPGIREIEPTVDASPKWLAQVKLLLGQDELGGLAADLEPTTANLAKALAESLGLFGQLDKLSLCSTRVMIPTAKAKISDGPFSTGAESYKEFFYTLVGLSGFGQSFDANGNFLKLDAQGGDTTYFAGQTKSDTGTIRKFFTNSSSKNPLQGMRPAPPSPFKPPALKPEVACKGQNKPGLSDAGTSAPATVATGSTSFYSSDADGSEGGE